MFIVTDARGRSAGLPAYRLIADAKAAARALAMVSGEVYQIRGVFR